MAVTDSEYCETVSTGSIWDNYCNLVSDTAICRPDIYVSFHSIILYYRRAPGCRRPLRNCARPAEKSGPPPAPLFLWNTVHFTLYTMQTMSQVSLMHSSILVILTFSILPYIRDGFVVIQGGGLGDNPQGEGS